MTTERVRRTPERSDAARERVLHAALRAIAANGYRGSTLAVIAADAGLTTAGLLHHFPSKEHLLVAVLAERDRLDTAHFELSGCRGFAALDRLVELVRYNAMLPGLVQAFTVLLGESVGSDHPAREWLRDRYPRIRADIAQALRGGIDLGEIRPDVNCDAKAAEIVAMMDGLQVQWLLDPDQVDMAAIFADFIAVVRRAVAVGNG